MSGRPLSTDNTSPDRAGFLWLLFSAFIVYGTLIPFNRCATMAEVQSNFAGIRWMPFIDADGSRASIPDVVQNILLFVPFGFLGVLSLQRRGRSAILIIVILGALLSAGVEILQLFTLDRTTSLTDLATNTIGTILGSQFAQFLFNVLPKLVPANIARRFLQNEYSYLLGAALLLVVLGSLQPFDFTLDVGTVWSKVKAVRPNPFSFGGPLRDEGVVFLRFFLFGCVSVLWFREWIGRPSLISGIAFAAMVAVILEGLQIIVMSRMPSLRDVLVSVAGTIAGGCFAQVPFRSLSVSRWSALAIGATFVTAAMQILSPFRIASEYRLIHLFPFLLYYDRTTFVALSNFIESALMFLPMGFLLQLLYPLGHRMFWRVFWLSGVIALSLELAQGWIIGRYPDITDVLGATVGALAGVWLCHERAFFEGLFRRGIR